MANWLDDLERKKKEEDERFRAKLAADVKRYEAERDANEKLYASLKSSFEPIFLKLDTPVQRANKNNFFLIAQRGQYSHEYKIFRYNAEHSRVDVPLNLPPTSSTSLGSIRTIKSYTLRRKV